jgi:hypothetical protein
VACKVISWSINGLRNFYLYIPCWLYTCSSWKFIPFSEYMLRNWFGVLSQKGIILKLYMRMRTSNSLCCSYIKYMWLQMES